jgi:class 3 adenylate cyclase/TolB-like protein
MESERLPRKLAAILYADVAGYSRATGADEDATHQTLSEYLDAVSAVVERHRGSIKHYAGDAVLATFAAAVDALRAATEIHRDVAARNETLPAERRIQFRVGVNLGDVIEDRGDVYGNGVNVAARLAALAEPGGICVSESVRVAVGQRLPIAYRDIGAQNLKNIDEAVRAYRATAAAGLSVPKARRVSVGRDKRVHAALAALAVLAVGFGVVRFGDAFLGAAERGYASSTRDRAQMSIAVLPFANLGAQDDEYFSDGLTDELIVRLARVPGLKVSPRTSSFYFKGRQELPKTIASELGVRYLLEGSISRSGDRQRVRVQLSDSELGTVLWAPPPFDYENTEAFSIQDRISLAVVENLEVTLRADPRSSVTRHSTDKVEAQDLYFRAKYLGQSAELPELNRAVEYYERAVEVDPSYAAAYVGLADTLIRRAQFAELQPQSVYQRARELLRRALDLEASAAAHGILAFMANGEFDCNAARKELMAAESLDPNNVDMLIHFSRHMFVCDWQPESALNYAHRAADLDRLNPWAALHVTLATWHQFDYEAALGEVDRLSARFPDYWIADWSRWWILSDLDRHEEALAVAQRVIELNNYNETQTCLAVSLARLGRLEEARAIYDEQAALVEAGRHWNSGFQAMLLVALGDDDAALDALEEGYERRETDLASILHIKPLRPLHDSSRFWRLVDRLDHRRQVEALIQALGQA